MTERQKTVGIHYTTLLKNITTLPMKQNGQIKATTTQQMLLERILKFRSNYVRVRP